MMPVQETITGKSTLIGNKTKVKYANNVVKQEFHSYIQGVIPEYGDKEIPVIKIENKYGGESYYRDVEPVEYTEEYFLYPVTEETFEKFDDVEEIPTERL